MKKTLYILLTLLLLWSSVFAQSGNSRLEELNSQIRTARELLRLFPDEQAQNMLDNAITQRNEALTLYNRGRNNLAMAKLKAAALLVSQVIDRVSAVPVDRIQEQVDELVRNAEQLVPGQKNPEAERLLRQAKENRQAGVRAIRNKQTRKAMEHFRVAKFYAERSISMVKSTGLSINRDTLEDEKARFQELMDRAEELVDVCDNSQAIKLVTQARDQYDNIQQAIQSGNYKVAVNLYYSNTRLLLRAIDLCQGQGYSVREQAIEEVEMLGDLINSASDEQDGKSDSQSRFILQRVQQIYKQANNALNAENYEIAIRRAVLGRNVINRLWNKSAQPLKDKIENELERLKADINSLKNSSSQNRRTARPLLIDAAQNCVNEAEQFLATGRERLALEMVYAGNRFVNAAALAPNKQELKKEFVQQRVDQLEQEIGKYNSQNEQNDIDLVNEAEKMLQHASQALSSDRYFLANEYVKLGFNFLDKVQK